MIAYCSGDAYASWRAFSLEPCRYIHRVSVQISSVGNRIAEVDPNAKADGSIRRLIAIVDRNLLLHLHGAAHGSVDAVKDDEQGIAACLHDPATMLSDRRVNQILPESP